MRRPAFALLLFAAALAGPPAGAADLHRLWEERCARCHGDAGGFARDALSAADERLQGRLQGRLPERDLHAFLLRHQGGLPEAEAQGVYAMLLAQAQTPPLFQERCGLCHPKAADLVRDQLVLRDGVLVGRYTGRPVAAFLETHGRIAADERPFFMDLLTRLAREVDRAP
ncbi:MAG TPA: hypothetical protein VD995_17415 [Azospirillum sp.]|nr:hypothetical protein [Azospirillum sp.]